MSPAIIVAILAAGLTVYVGLILAAERIAKAIDKNTKAIDLARRDR